MRERDAGAAEAALGTIERLSRNILDAPKAAKYRRIKRNNDALQTQVFAQPEVAELLRVAGFVPDGDDVFLPLAAPLCALQELREAALQSSASSAVGAASVPQGALATSEAICLRLRARDPAMASVVLGTLGKVLKNVVLNPQEAKFRRLRGSNERIRREVLAHPEAVEILRLVGFTSDSEDLLLPVSATLDAVRELDAAGILQ